MLLTDRAQISVPKTILKKPGSLEKWLTPRAGPRGPKMGLGAVSSSTKRREVLRNMTQNTEIPQRSGL